MRLLLVRHGESNAIASGVVGGPTGCTGLTERGVKQAEALRDRFAREAFVADVLLASPLPRACQTGEIIGAAFGLAPTLDPEIRELDPGEADGIAWTEWRERYGFDMFEDRDRPQSPGGESWNVFHQRVTGKLERLREEHDGRTVIAACHGGPIFTVMNHLFGSDLGRVYMAAAFTSITELEWTGERWTLHRYNDVAHLLGTRLLPT